MNFEPLLDVTEAAALLGIHPKTLQALARKGAIPCARIGKYWRFRASALDTWVSERIQSTNTATAS
jgi:excisionase family DNA binding protein